ncbi:hypothetical protein [Thiolapillus sp.]|uniref:hypothetical protein n=1 Tax=Thiolapillus sp. TaxID=2017437 RepID=UPI003AF42151
MFSLWRKARRENSAASRLLGSTSLRFALHGWQRLQPLEHPHYVVDMLHKSGLCRQYPEEALYLLAAVISDQPGVPEALGRCLDEIRKVESRLVQDARYTQLQEYLRIRKSQ